MSIDDSPQEKTKNDLSRTSSIDSESSRSTKERSGNNSANNISETINTSARPTLHHNSRSTSTSNITFAANTNLNTGHQSSKTKLHPQRLKTHNRSLSHNKLVSKLSTSSSNTIALRPNLNRSKSTDGLIKGARSNSALKRNGRSFTKVTGLQPLTKTMSNQSLKSNKSTTSLKGIGSTSSIGLKTSAKKGKAILSLNDDDGDFEDVDEPVDQAPIPERFDSQETVSTTHLNSEQNIPSLYEQINRIVPDPTPLEENKKLEVLEESTNKENSSTKQESNTATKDSSEDFSNLYGGSLLLSQSTGLVKKIDTRLQDAFGAEEMKYSDSVSGISFKANPIDNIAQPVTTNKNVNQNNSYQPNQTIFNNLQRTNNQYMQSKKQSDQVPSKIATSLNNGANNFSDFLKSNQSSSTDLNNSSHNLETRTQQRLWLQRESSLMDVTNLDANRMSNFSNLSLNNLMFAHNYNQSLLNMRDSNGSTPTQYSSSLGQLTPGITEHPSNSNMTSGLLMMVQNTQNSIQSRTEFERLNREYLNVRRHLNPVGESLNRVNKYLHKNEIKVVKNRKSDQLENINSFKEYSLSYQEKEDEISSTINRLWQDAIISTSSQNPRSMHQPHQSQRAFQRPKNPRLASYGQQQYSYNGISEPKGNKLANSNE